MCGLSLNLGAFTSWNTQGLSRPVMGLRYLLCVLRSPNASVFLFWVSLIQIFVSGVLVSVRARTRCGLISKRTAVRRKVACSHDIYVMTFATHFLYSPFFTTQIYVSVISVNHDCANPFVLAQSLMRRMLLRYSDVCGPGSSVGIATDYGLDGPGDRIPVGARFFAHVQTGPGAHPASCKMGTGSFPGIKRPGRGADHPPPPRAEVENE
jgi:hypothetical protein